MPTDREYKQGVATLGFDGGPQVVFRLNPNEVNWNFQVNTNVTETVGGRVVQVLGATLSDMTITGSFGELRGATHTESKVLAERFLAAMKVMAEYQSRDSRTHAAMHKPATFAFPSKNWKFLVYIKNLTDPQGGMAIVHQTGKFSYDYVLTLMVHADVSDTSKIIGKSNGLLMNQKNKVIQSYIDRIADGIGWHYSEYNGAGSGILGQGDGKPVPPIAGKPGQSTPNESGDKPAVSSASEASLIEFGKYLQGLGFNVAEHAAFGGVHPVHSAGSWHYKNGAIDVNYDGKSVSEKTKINGIVAEAKKRGFRTIWQYPGHYDHVHFDLGKGADLGNF